MTSVAAIDVGEPGIVASKSATGRARSSKPAGGGDFAFCVGWASPSKPAGGALGLGAGAAKEREGVSAITGGVSMLAKLSTPAQTFARRPSRDVQRRAAGRPIAPTGVTLPRSVQSLASRPGGLLAGRRPWRRRPGPSSSVPWRRAQKALDVLKTS